MPNAREFFVNYGWEGRFSHILCKYYFQLSIRKDLFRTVRRSSIVRVENVNFFEQKTQFKHAFRAFSVGTRSRCHFIDNFILLFYCHVENLHFFESKMLLNVFLRNQKCVKSCLRMSSSGIGGIVGNYAPTILFFNMIIFLNSFAYYSACMFFAIYVYDTNVIQS